MRLSRHHLTWAAIALLIAFIILPTGTPEDIVTTYLFIKLFGLSAYLWMALIALLLLLLAGEEK